MKNSKTLFQDFVKQVTLPERAEEISGIAFLVFENLFRLSKTDIFSEKPIDVSKDHEARLTDILLRINHREPIQYILGEADFFGRKFEVNPAVLIPRPETEELVSEILDFYGKTSTLKKLHILDIGTGSGCIAITLSLAIKDAQVYASDVSLDALTVARRNAERLKADVSFIHNDILKEEITANGLDVIVSNPPYITFEEKNNMNENVVRHEPHLALFVSNDDPVIFYKAIVQKSKKMLRPEGTLWVEINEQHGNEVMQLLLKSGFRNVKIIRDLSGKERMVWGMLARP
jgi:release factor glutamine methyltransferase